ncbi:poly-gamma-glutamate synthesis protein (capsule biosynthesis protein) [Halopolyspora algeriensis]|uniref:Poly-gamma-glutamate synthesis protein (Capsule biosynthesis protein) n=1 Tax=Halopolyspora algeriensis TaxID=1500506 RepID=A0A368VV43_9ACTN|nr:CapA family protein [Halopolyspora algeriensis]RCW45765.1 poly-gamma-glutamate synthesis protein (capsule biosynthesis protein) [Halopolyspora algeriensis]TQM54149.1 poly-gamma-glutamate synthesis protein (capsule biosynthesis protein) [Halopolyspora algeriensis]
MAESITGRAGWKVMSVAAAAALILVGCSPPPADTVAGADGPQAAPAPATETGEDSRPEPVRVMFTGDMLPNDELLAQAKRNAGGRGYDFMPMLEDMAPIISAADWAVCQQETPISADNSTISTYPQFSAPHQLARAESAIGYDACSTASNHSADYGATGIRSTLEALDRYGIRHTGTARSRAEARESTIYEVKGARIGHLAYTYGLNGLPEPEPWSVDLIDAEQIRADARRLDRAGAEIVTVSLHWGTSKRKQPSEYQQRVADAVLRSPHIDLIVGHHAHVVQPIEQRADGQWVLYGLGNFLAQQDVSASDPNPPHRDGMIAEVTFTPTSGGDWRIDRVGYIPTFYDASRGRVVVAPPFSRKRTTKTVTSMGADVVERTPAEPN